MKIGSMTLIMHKTIQENENHSKVPIVNLPLIHAPETPNLKPTNIQGIYLTDLKLLASTLKRAESTDDSEKVTIIKQCKNYTQYLYQWPPIYHLE